MVADKGGELGDFCGAEGAVEPLGGVSGGAAR